MDYSVVIEQGDSNYSAYLSDLPGCASIGDTLEEVQAEIREAIGLHLEGARQDGLPIPSSLPGSLLLNWTAHISKEIYVPHE